MSYRLHSLTGLSRGLYRGVLEGTKGDTGSLN